MISDFEEGLVARFGAGWSVTNDAMRDGNSTAEIELAEGGAGESRRSLAVKGVTREGYLHPLGRSCLRTREVTTGPGQSLLEKGDPLCCQGRLWTYEVGMVATILGLWPMTRSFLAGGEWESFEFSFEEFGIDGFDVLGIVFVYHEKRPFAFQIDDVALT